MMRLQITTAVLGAGMAVCILYLVRRDRLHLSHGVFWIVAALGAALLGLWPGLIDTIAGALGVNYAPALLLLGAVIILFVKSLLGDIANTRIEREVRRLNQRIALYEADKDPE